jgi:hypothetical protein
MESLSRSIVARYFDKALKGVKDESGPMDRKALEALNNTSSATEGRAEIIASWIRHYRAHRAPWNIKGADGSFSLEVGKIAIRIYDSKLKSVEIDPIDRFQALSMKIHEKYKEKTELDRSHLSLTSKLTWLMHPEVAPIYDAFAKRTLLILDKCFKSLNDSTEPDVVKHENTVKPLSTKADKADKDLQQYLQFSSSYMRVFEKFQPEICSQLRAKKNVSETASVYPIRIFDKILWIMGSFSNDV